MKSTQILFVTVALLLTVSIGCDDAVQVEPEPRHSSEPAWTMDIPPDVGRALLAVGKKPLIGSVSPVVSFPLGESVEGIAIDKRGNLYAGKRTMGPGTVSEVVRISSDGIETPFASLPSSGPGTFGVLGLVTDPPGNVYAALASAEPSTQGVYRISKDGTSVERLAGSEQITLPNALTFDARGNLYVTDSMTGKIWRYDRNGSFVEWFQHALLEAIPVPGAPFPIPGANGIVFYPPNKLYVANTSQWSLTRVLIGADGAAVSIESIVPFDFLLAFVDGIAVDVHENVYGVLATANAEEVGAPSIVPVVKVDPQTGIVTPVLIDVSDFDTPTSLAFGTGGPWGRQDLFVTNSALFGPVTNGPGSGVVQVYAGKPGHPGH